MGVCIVRKGKWSDPGVLEQAYKHTRNDRHMDAETETERHKATDIDRHRQTTGLCEVASLHDFVFVCENSADQPGGVREESLLTTKGNFSEIFFYGNVL
jgi:hypothetical protein